MMLATLCYIKKDSRTLMVHRNKKPDDMHAGKWNGLGGKFEPGESPEECVLREVREESGLHIRDPRLAGLLMFPGFKGDDWYVFVFTARDFEGALIDSPEGELAWVPDQELASLNLWESDHIFFPWLDGEKVFTAKFIYAGDRLQSYQVNFYP
jgi:8-oxo-dGTP diphosphatase